MPPKHKPAPAPNAPKEEHRKHAEEFLAREEHKKPKSGQYVRSDEAKP